MPTSYTLAQIRQALAEEAYRGEYPVLLGTTAGGTTTTAVFGPLAFGTSGATTSAYHGVWLFIAENPGGGPAVGEVSRILATGGFAPASGTVTVAPAFTAAVANSTDCLFYYSEHPTTHRDAINRVLRGLAYETYLPLTLVVDGDMEASGTTDWLTTGAATLSKIASPFIFGRQALQVVASGAAAGANTTVVPVIPRERLMASVPIRFSSGSSAVTVNLLETVTATTIASAVISPNPGTGAVEQEARLQGSVPSGGSFGRIQVLTNTGAATFAIGPVSLLSDQRDRYTVATQIAERARDIKELFWLVEGPGTAQTNAFLAFREKWRPISFAIETDERAGAGGARLTLRYTPPNAPVYMRVTKRFPELTAETDTTVAHRDVVVAGAMYYIEQARAAKESITPDVMRLHLAKAAEWRRRFYSMRETEGYGVSVTETPGARVAVGLP